MDNAARLGYIDFHVHITPPEISENWRKYAENEPHFAMLCQSRTNAFASAEDVVAGLDEAGFEQAVVFGFGFRDPGLCRYVNDYVIEKVKQYPRRLLGFMAVPPAVQGVEKEIERCFKAGLCGVGEIFPEGQGFDLDNQKESAPFAETCAALGLPVLIHVNEPVGHSYPGKTGVSLSRIDRFIGRNPNLVIILAHWGGGLCFYEAMPELREKYKNVYYDTAATPFLYDPSIFRAAQALGLGKKILFGSDFPLLRLSRYIKIIGASGIGAEEQELILGGNARRLLHLEE
jgi:predicted TIM-barrel fold metal-dependent hydrolase